MALGSVRAAAGQGGFGANGRSFRLAISFFTAFVLLNHGSMVFRWAIARRHARGSFPRVAARPVSVAVLWRPWPWHVCRGWNPRWCLVPSLSLITASTPRERVLRPALAAMAGSACVALLGLAAWAGFGFLATHHVDSLVRWHEIQPGRVAAVSDALAWRLTFVVGFSHGLDDRFEPVGAALGASRAGGRS